MPVIKKALYDLTKTQQTRTYVETGTYRGDGIKQVLRLYEFIHSIELSEHWYTYNMAKYMMEPHVYLWWGDSALYLSTLLKQMEEPVTIYLDAHDSGPDTAECDYGGTSLLQELDVLRQRTWDDIVIVDDGALLGKKGFWNYEGTEVPYDWTHVTEDRIKALMKPNYVMLHNTGRIYTDGAEDQIILVRANPGSSI